MLPLGTQIIASVEATPVADVVTTVAHDAVEIELVPSADVPDAMVCVRVPPVTADDRFARDGVVKNVTTPDPGVNEDIAEVVPALNSIFPEAPAPAGGAIAVLDPMKSQLVPLQNTSPLPEPPPTTVA